MTTWQRRLRLGLGLFVVVFAAVVFFAIRREPPRAAHPPVAATDPKAVVAIDRKGELRQTQGGRKNAYLKFDRMASYPGGVTRLFKVEIPPDAEAGRNYTVTAEQAEVGADESSYALDGNVRVTGSDGLRVAASRGTYSNAEKVVRVPGPVTFSRGGLSGSAVGLTYDQARDLITLLDRVVIVAAAEDDEPATEIVAATATWARKDRYMRFERGVKIVRGPQTTEADAATAFLTDDEKRLRAIELRGRARITGGEGGAGSLRAMRARDMNLGYAADGRNLETAMLVGNGSIAIAGAPEGSDRRLAAEWIDLGVGPDGSTLTRLNARDKVQMDLPAEADTPARVIRAGSLTGTAAAGGAQPGGITRARFDEGVQFTETTTRAGPPRSARATTMDLVVKPGFSAVEEATFIGAVRFEDGDIVATARDARYDVAHGRLVMPALETTKDDRPKVVMPDATIEARRIELTFEGSKIQARDTVSSVLQPSSRNPAEAGSHGVTGGKARNPAEAGSETRMPAMLDDDQPTYATADELAYDDSSARAVYTGSARLWQGETRVQGDRIELDDRKGDLRAQGSVVTRFLLDNTDQKTSEKKKVETIGRARELVYEEETHRARYTGAAQVAGPDGTITADRIDLYLDEAGDAVERAEASGEGGTVTVEQQGRTAKGDHLTYTAADERYVMIGKVVRIVQETRETLGKTLTFFKSADTIIIDGARETRTQTKSGKKVGEASPRGAEGGPRERSANLREFQSWARGRCGESGSVATWPRSGHTI